MASTREERMQQRLRGSQRRQVKDVDFGLTFAPISALAQHTPALPAATRRSPRRSTELAPQASTRPTPANRAQSQPPSTTPADENVRPAVTHNGVDANTSAKRRKLDSDEPSTSMRSTRSSLPAPRGDVYALGEEEVDPDAADNTNGSIELSTEIHLMAEPDTSPSFMPQRAARTPTPLVGEEEITESPSHAPGSGQRMRTQNAAVRQNSRLQDELNSVQIEPSGSPTPQRKRKRATSLHPTPSTTRSLRSQRSVVSNEVNESADEIDELSPEQPKRGRRRRSSIQRESLKAPVVAESADERESAEEIDDAETAAILKKNKEPRISRRAPAEPSPDLDEPSELVLPVPKKRWTRPIPIPSPAKQRHPKNANTKAISKPSKEAANKQIRIGSPIPITVHRLTKHTTYYEDESDADILNSEIPHARREGVNVIDTLNEFAVEVITSALETLQNNSRNTQDPALKREFRNKHRVVEDFQRQLSMRLLDHTINLDNTSSLEKRVREEDRKKKALTEELLRVKAEVQMVKVRQDEVRMNHEMESTEAQNQDFLNTAIHDIELAVERGKEMNPRDLSQGPVEKVGVELLLKRVANEVSSKSGSGGILKQIKDFNAFLERTAVTLEGKA